MLFKKFQINKTANKIKYGSIKAVNFTIDELYDFYRIMIQKCIQSIMKENMLLLKNSLEP